MKRKDIEWQKIGKVLDGLKNRYPNFSPKQTVETVLIILCLTKVISAKQLKGCLFISDELEGRMDGTEVINTFRTMLENEAED